MEQANGSQSIIEGDNIGVGLTIDKDGDPVVLVWISQLGQHLGVALTEEAALALSQTLVGMASEITKAKDEADITPEELNIRLQKIVEDVANRGHED